MSTESLALEEKAKEFSKEKLSAQRVMTEEQMVITNNHYCLHVLSEIEKANQMGHTSKNFYTIPMKRTMYEVSQLTKRPDVRSADEVFKMIADFLHNHTDLSVKIYHETSKYETVGCTLTVDWSE